MRDSMKAFGETVLAIVVLNLLGFGIPVYLGIVIGTGVRAYNFIVSP